MGPEGVNGVSILANSPNLAQEMKALADLPGDARVAVHLNLVEGKPLTAASALPHLTNADGIFDVSFGRLLAASFIPGRRQKYASEIRREFAAQIAEAEKYLGKAPLRLDGHVHYHMIPVVFDAMMDLIREEPVDVRIAFVFRLQPFVMAVLGSYAACRTFLESHDRVWHMCLLLCLTGVFKEHCNSACIQGLQC